VCQESEISRRLRNSKRLVEVVFDEMPERVRGCDGDDDLNDYPVAFAKKCCDFFEELVH
jgi:hypothetical protein